MQRAKPLFTGLSANDAKLTVFDAGRVAVAKMGLVNVIGYMLMPELPVPETFDTFAQSERVNELALAGSLRPYYIVNRTATVFVAVRWKKVTDRDFGPWQGTRIPKTCNDADAKRCVGHWVQVANLECGVLYNSELEAESGAIWEGKNLGAACKYQYGWAVIG
jgi:hypothetical protein